MVKENEMDIFCIGFKIINKCRQVYLDAVCTFMDSQQFDSQTVKSSFSELEQTSIHMEHRDIYRLFFI